MATIDIVLKDGHSGDMKEKVVRKNANGVLTVDMINIKWGNVDATNLIVLIHENHDIAIAMSSSRADPVMG